MRPPRAARAPPQDIWKKEKQRRVALLLFSNILGGAGQRAGPRGASPPLHAGLFRRQTADDHSHFGFFADFLHRHLAGDFGHGFGQFVIICQQFAPCCL